MPSVSKAQARAMFAAASGKSTLGIPKSVGQEFTADQTPGSVKKLPPRAHALRQRGMISKAPTVARRPKRRGLFDDVDGLSGPFVGLGGHYRRYDVANGAAGGTDQTPIKASSR
jgi:hypothetical protein